MLKLCALHDERTVFCCVQWENGMEQESAVVTTVGPSGGGGASTHALPQEGSFVNQDFLTKNTTFGGKPVSFCLQSFDGPCPLLAVANVLLLRNKLRIKPGADRLNTRHILTVVGDAITSHLGAEQSDDLESCLDELRKLQFGLQVNCGFRSCTSFERSAGFRVFDLLGIKVLHGWLPEDPETESVLEGMTYNEAAELLAMADDVETRSHELHDNNLSSDKLELLHKGAIVRRFLDASPSQLTFEGLIKIHAALQEGCAFSCCFFLFCLRSAGSWLCCFATTTFPPSFCTAGCCMHW